MGGSSSVPNGPVGDANQNNPSAVVKENPCQTVFNPNELPGYSNQSYHRRYEDYLKRKKDDFNRDLFY